MVFSGIWGDREGIFAPFNLLFSPERFQPVQGSYAGSPAGRVRGGGKDQSRGHSAQNVWEKAPVGKPWQIWPLEMSDLTDRPKEPLPWCLHSPLPPAQPLTQLYLKVLQSSFGYPWLCYLHGIVTLALTGSVLMQDMIIKFVTVNCSNLAWLIQKFDPFL